MLYLPYYTKKKNSHKRIRFINLLVDMGIVWVPNKSSSYLKK